ncbi:hypothetical protein CPB86DRAFT_781617 [Serendipita vermifera]|nr:hypothetical protein CPB86DRAFT_781617 [Serendipita vermifera]
MSKVQTFFLKRTSAFIKKDKAPTTGPSRLPTELLVVVIDFVNDRRELHQLCRTCHLFRAMAEPKLYRLHFAHTERAMNMDIYKLIRHPRLETILNTLELTLWGCPYCERRLLMWPTTLLQKLGLKWTPCTCDKLDKSVGIALGDLFNLRILHLSCVLCQVDSHKRHGWITTLKTNSLQEITFTCTCSIMDEATTVEIFGAPCMTSLTTLGWHPCRRTTVNKGGLEFTLIRSDILPNLRHLDFWSGDTNSSLLCHRPITRLVMSIDEGDIVNYEDLRSTNGRLTHLNILAENWGVFGSFFIDIIAENLSPFRNLQHLGSFLLNSSTSIALLQELHTILTRFVLLQSLVSLEAEVGDDEYSPGGDYSQVFKAGLPELSQCFPNLRRVFFRHVPWTTDIWMLSGAWEIQAYNCKLENFHHLKDWEVVSKEIILL